MLMATYFAVSPIDWEPRLVGDETTNPRPSFAPNSDDETDARPINKVLFYRNRLVFLSDENVIMSRSSDFFNLGLNRLSALLLLTLLM